MEDGDYDAITIEGSDWEEEPVVDEESSVGVMRRRLKERREGIRRSTSRSSVCIYRVPHSLIGINPKANQPEIVSIGPYHRGKDELLEFESYKWCFLDSLLSRTKKKGLGLGSYYKAMKELEESTRRCYSEFIPMSSNDFVEMMVLDGCFIVEILRHVCRSEDVIDENDPIFAMPWLIPILIRDLLKLENQLPFFVLERLFDLSKVPGNKGDPLPLLALKFFNLALPRSVEILKRSRMLEGKHLLDLFHLSFLPALTPDESQKYRPSSDQSIQCVTQLRPSGIKFRPRRADSFLEIDFKNGVLEIPCITINDFTITVFINCIALEQCRQYSPTCFSTYVAFMSCLVNSGRDVTFLCGDGIVTSFSQNDQYVARIFRKLGENIVFNIRECYLSKQFREVEAYYSSYWATLTRTYFSSPWSFISVSSAFILLVLTVVQTITAILSYKGQP